MEDAAHTPEQLVTETVDGVAMAEKAALREMRCSLLLLVATPAEEKGLKEAADACGVHCVKVRARESRLGVDYYDLGPVGNEIGVIALPPSRDDENNLVMGSIGFFGTAARAMRLRTATGGACDRPGWDGLRRRPEETETRRRAGLDVTHPVRQPGHQACPPRSPETIALWRRLRHGVPAGYA